MLCKCTLYITLPIVYILVSLIDINLTFDLVLVLGSISK